MMIFKMRPALDDPDPQVCQEAQYYWSQAQFPVNPKTYRGD